MPKARARLAPTTSMINAPTTASTICVWTTAGWRGGVPLRRGRSASAVPSTAASGSRSAAATSSSWKLSAIPGRSTGSVAGAGAP